MSLVPRYEPRIPERSIPVGLIGAGAIARTAHMPAYKKWGIDVAAIASRDPNHARRLADDFSVVAAESVHALLDDPGIPVVDIATGPEERLDLLEAAIEAGKNVLTQKPLITRASQLPRLDEILSRARSRRLRVAVNQNGRWAPAWRLATQFVRNGALGDIVGVTHLHDKPLPPIAGTRFDDIPHMLISDYLSHWIDITRCWLEGSRVSSVTAIDTRVPGQPADARSPWHASILITTTTGASASIRVVGDAKTRAGGCPFWIHGTKGTIRGSVLRGTAFLELESGGDRAGFDLTGDWFPDGFAGAMGELLTAVDRDVEPENSASHVLPGALISLAAEESAARRGEPVYPPALDLFRASAGEGVSKHDR